ncbi:MAG: hypothetical protein J7F05_10750 [Trichodesmium erythraeum GBRTRLIN201]|nr:hypothetical protein [Trichodesmium erythraeum GBRTRLIN201]
MNREIDITKILLQSDYVIQNLSQRLALDRVDSVLTFFLERDLLDKEGDKFLINLSSRHSRNEKAKSSGEITYEEYKIEKNLIIEVLEHLISNNIDYSKITLPSPLHETNKEKRNSFLFAINIFSSIYNGKKQFLKEVPLQFFSDNWFFKGFYVRNGFLYVIILLVLIWLSVNSGIILFQNPDLEQQHRIGYTICLFSFVSAPLIISIILFDYWLINLFKRNCRCGGIALNGINLFLQERYEEANTELTYALEIQEISILYELRSQTHYYSNKQSKYSKREKEINDLIKAVNLRNTISLKLSYRLARVLMYSCDFKNSLLVIESILKNSQAKGKEEFDEFFTLKGIVLFSEGLFLTVLNDKEGLAKLDQSMQFIKKFPTYEYFLYVIKGCKRMHMKEYKEAIDCFDNIYHLDSWVEWLHELLGDCYRYLKERKKAFKHYNAIINSIPFGDQTIENRLWGTPEETKKRLAAKVKALGGKNILDKHYQFLES